MAANSGVALGIYKTMITIRAFEERVSREFKTGDMPGFVHMYIGEEAIAAGVCANLTEADYITSTHRGHGHCIAKGCSIKGMMAELFGRETGLCKGRGGSMHIADFNRGMLGANAIVGGGLPLATGAALAAQVRGSDQVAVCFFGDGANNQGVFHESLNLAAIWSLPVVYVCENNGFAESTPFGYATSVSSVAARGASYGIPGAVVDSSDALGLFEEARTAINRARRGKGPSLIEARTYRFYGHFEGDPEQYRTDDERRSILSKDPIPPLRDGLLEDGVVTDVELAEIHADVAAELDEAVAFARSSPWPESAAVDEYVYAAERVLTS